jgi:uncharacterized protein YjdB
MRTASSIPRQALSALAALFLAAACGDEGLSPDGVTRITLHVPADRQELYVGDTVRVLATPLGFDGRSLTGRTVHFASSDPTVATVDAITGLVTALGPGTTNITATSEAVSAATTLRVRLAPVATIVVTPEARTLHPQWTVMLTVALSDAAGRALTGRQIDFTSSNPNVANVGSTGLVTAGGVGTATITATSEGRSDIVLITVTPAEIFAMIISPNVRVLSDGTVLQYSAFARDERGFTLSDRPITWETSDASVAVVSSTGLVTARVPGGVMITARSGSVSASLPLTVRPHIATIAVTPTKDTLRSGEFGAVELLLTDAAGNRLVDRDVTLMSSNPGVVAVLNDGRLRAMDVGTAVLTARAEGRAATATVVVIQPVLFVWVSPSLITVAKESRFQLTVSVLDPRGQALTGRIVTYESSNPAVATVDASGVVTGIASGSAVITVTCEGKSGSATVTVR